MSTFRFRFIWHLNIDSNATGWMVCSLLLWMWFCVDMFLCFVLSFGSIARFGRRRRFTFVRMSCPRMKLDAQMDMEMGKPIEMCTTNERRTYRTIWTHTQTHPNCKWNGTHIKATIAINIFFGKRNSAREKTTATKHVANGETNVEFKMISCSISNCEMHGK